MKLRWGEKIFYIISAGILASCVYYFIILNGPVKGLADPMPKHLSAAALRGENIYINLKCDECHNVYSIIGDSGTSLAGADNLGGEGARRSFSWIDEFLTNPDTLNPGLVASGTMSALGQELANSYTSQFRSQGDNQQRAAQLGAAQAKVDIADLSSFLFSLKVPPGPETMQMPTT